MYGLSSSTTSSAFTNIQRRCIQQSRLVTETLNPLKITSTSPTLRRSRPSILALLRGELTFRHMYHHGHKQHRQFVSFSALDDDQERLYSVTSHNQSFARTQHQRQITSLFSTTSNDVRDGTKNTSDSNGIASQQKLDLDIPALEFPAFRLFYNDVYEVKLPPRHRFPMGKYRKVRERVQEKISKSLLEGVKCGKSERNTRQ